MWSVLVLAGNARPATELALLAASATVASIKTIEALVSNARCFRPQEEGMLSLSALRRPKMNFMPDRIKSQGKRNREISNLRLRFNMKFQEWYASGLEAAVCTFTDVVHIFAMRGLNQNMAKFFFCSHIIG